jgi:YVTN family beta-propeller protein
VDIATNKVIATIPVGPAESEGGIAASSDAIWLPSDKTGVLSRIDPKTNEVVASIKIAAGSPAAVYGDGAIWVSSTEESVVTRVDAKTNEVTEQIPVGPKPRFLTFGKGSVWTMNQGDGTVTRIDAKTRKPVATIEVGVPGTGGEIALRRGVYLADGVPNPAHADRPEDQRCSEAMGWAGWRRSASRPRLGMAVELAPAEPVAH